MAEALWIERTLAFKVLPALRDAADSELLVEPFTEHLEVTQAHVVRVEQLFVTAGAEPTAAASAGLEGLWQAYEQRHGSAVEPRLGDLVAIDTAARGEHLELAVYEGLGPLFLAIDVAPEPLEQIMADERHALDALERVREALVERLPH